MGGKEDEQVMESIIVYEQKEKIEGMGIMQIAHLLERSEEEMRKVVEMKS